MNGQFENKRVLITGKTYPNPARKGVEVSCVGGLTEEGQWIRLFPIPFRLLADEKNLRNMTKLKSRLRGPAATGALKAIGSIRTRFE